MHIVTVNVGHTGWTGCYGKMRAIRMRKQMKSLLSDLSILCSSCEINGPRCTVNIKTYKMEFMNGFAQIKLCGICSTIAVTDCKPRK